MRSVRRPLTAVVLLGAAALIASACGPAGGGALTYATECPVDALDTADGTVDITLWHSYVGLTEQTLNDIADSYNAGQDRVHVDVQSQGVGYEELQRKYERAIPADDLPDIAILEDTYTQSLADLGTVLPAAQCAEADGYTDFQDDFLPITTDYYSVPGTVNGEETDVLLPGSVNLATALLYYNRDHFEAAGLDPDDPPQTLDELADAARAIKDAGITDQPFVWNMQPWMVEFWLTGAGAPLVNNNNGRDIEGATAAAFDNPTTLPALRVHGPDAGGGPDQRPARHRRPVRPLLRHGPPGGLDDRRDLDRGHHHQRRARGHCLGRGPRPRGPRAARDRREPGRRRVPRPGRPGPGPDGRRCLVHRLHGRRPSARRRPGTS